MYGLHQAACIVRGTLTFDLRLRETDPWEPRGHNCFADDCVGNLLSSSTLKELEGSLILPYSRAL
jgi:hypothetical protein